MKEREQPIRLPSPATLGRMWRESQRPDVIQQSDVVTSMCNLEALKAEAGKIVNKLAVSIHKFGEGGYNQVFVIVFDDGSDIVARVNCSRAQNGFGSTRELYSLKSLQSEVASEVATLRFLKEKTTILVPTSTRLTWILIMRWECDIFSRKGQIVGQHVSRVAIRFSEEEQERFFKQVIEIEKQLLKFSFHSIGSLIDDPVTGECVVGPFASTPLLPFYAEGCKVGPWKSSEDMLKDYARISYKLITNQMTLWKERRLLYKHFNGDGNNSPPISFFEPFYRLYMEGVQRLHFDKEFLFILHEMDMNDSIVAYDDPTRIVGVVDWQSTYALPLWVIVFMDSHITGLCVSDEAEKRWTSLRAEVLQSAVTSFKDAAGKDCDIRRQIFSFLAYGHIFAASPEQHCETFLSAWKG
ncbi:hypothetical protein M422DRAFT_238657 [Sphaerobolus stellatus SS14]|nr:hypothetical protein M422DRAFT_238657 [Sphaerobolus stellatus SS14]